MIVSESHMESKSQIAPSVLLRKLARGKDKDVLFFTLSPNPHPSFGLADY
jgi:hypothetical protein